MARTTEKLTALRVARASKPGMYSDGGGLYLQVTGAGAKSWIFRFTLRGRAREMGLGSLLAIGLADARTKAAECRKLKDMGEDPIDAKNAARVRARLDAAKALTFKAAAAAYIASHRTGWRNPKHAAQWESTLAAYVDPVIGNVPVQAVDVALVLKVLEPLWTTKTETASRLRGRLEAILDWATARGYRTGENPARWRGHLAKLLPARSKVRSVKHHAALPYEDLPAFMAKLCAQDGVAARALEFTILTAARTSETVGATLGEFNLPLKLWTVPATRIKAGREHRQPLSTRSLAIVQAASDNADPDHPWLFPGAKRGKPLSNMAMAALLARMGYAHITVHGFRSTFRDWAAERTNFPSEAAEMALAHAVGDKVEAAYRRGDMFEKRKRLMAEWCSYCEKQPAPASGSVTPMHRAAR